MYSKYSIWIVPNEPVNKQLQDIIVRLSKEFGGPVFEPHMTLIGDVRVDCHTIVEASRSLATTIAELQLSIDGASFSTTFFQSVFMKVRATAQLMELNLMAKKILNIENNLFLPHISLVYGEHSMTARENIVDSLGAITFPPCFAEQLVVVPSTNDPREWDHVACIPLLKNGGQIK